MRKYTLLFCIVTAGLLSCSGKMEIGETADELPAIRPDYAGVTVPPNIAPLNFTVETPHTDAQVTFSGKHARFTVKEKRGQFYIPVRRWRELLSEAAGDTVRATVRIKNEAGWKEYAPFFIEVAPERADAYLAYRLIAPGYELWDEMGIYQRKLESYTQQAVYETRMTQQNCVNCHSFCMQNPEKMLFHMRDNFACTVLIDGDKIEKLNTKTAETISPLVYPSWHPSGQFVAFSVNQTKQAFHTAHPNRVEVFDLASDVVVYDVQKHEIVTSPLLFSKDRFETFPTFSPDGKTLYFCSATARPMPDEFEQVKYSLCSIAFDPETRTFGQTADTLYNAVQGGKSASFPRVSPDGRYLLYTLSGYGNFSIWHKDADLYLADLHTNESKRLDRVNSDDVESYHSWSLNSRWFVFSSRRIDGLYTRPYIAYVDTGDEVRKPFLLPQEDVDFYSRFMQSYNIPEFITGPVPFNQYAVSRKVRNDAGIQVKSAFRR
ncbi:MAG: hypothetical protein LIP00_01945 [Parabacteroides sp.]|nr:hypothetical protein [Parabacteroides sp.]